MCTESTPSLFLGDRRTSKPDWRRKRAPAWWFVGKMVLCWIALVLLFVAAMAWGNHGAWHDHYRGANGLPCCGQIDCKKTHARLIAQTATAVTVEVEGVLVEIPAVALHQSEDTNDWLCRSTAFEAIPLTGSTIRCLFIASGT